MIVILVGPKGAGKSYIGRLLEAERGYHFFHVEPYWTRRYGRHGADVRAGFDEAMRATKAGLEEAAARHERVVFETTGSHPAFLAWIEEIAARHAVRKVRVDCSLPACLARIRARDPEHQVPMSEADVARVYALSEALDLAYDLRIENEEAGDADLLRSLDGLT